MFFSSPVLPQLALRLEAALLVPRMAEGPEPLAAGEVLGAGVTVALALAAEPVPGEESEEPWSLAGGK